MSESHNNKESEDKDTYKKSEAEDTGSHQADDEQTEKKPEKRRRLPVWAIILLILAAVVMIGAACVYFYVQSQLGRINRVEADEQTVVAPEDEYFESGETMAESMEIMWPEDVKWDADAKTFAQEGVTNILLIGQDGHAWEGRTRSDSMIIVSINKNTKKIALTSLMRDMYVQIPGYSDNRINAAYAFGGMELLDETIAKNFSIKIDGNVVVNFDGFESVIDAIGGVDMELTEKEAEYINKRNKDKGWTLTEGLNHLDGEKALEYSRIRKVGDGDFERTDRQRRVLMEVFDKMKNISVTQLMELMNELFPLMTTDMSNSQILGLGVDVLSMGVDSLETYRIPADDMYDEVRVFASDGTAMDVLIPDLSECRLYFYHYVYGNEDSTEETQDGY